MAEKKRDSQFMALEEVYAALKDLDADSQRKVLSSVSALLSLGTAAPTSTQAPQQVTEHRAALPVASRPVALVELIQSKNPGTNAQRIALFAYYREKTQNLPRFSRGDLEGYFAQAKLAPAANFDRDFVEAVRKGWIHEDGSDSYLTTKGVEAIESGFEGERRYSQARKATRRPRNKNRSRASSRRKKRLR